MPEPGPAQVRIKVEACGICHSDSFAVDGHLSRHSTIRSVPGHEIAGRIDAHRRPASPAGRSGSASASAGTAAIAASAPIAGAAISSCASPLKVPGIAYDGGYADYMIAPIEALAAIPDELDAAEAAPLLCAGITTFNALRNSGARPGRLVAVLGIGGLGHLGVQFARQDGLPHRRHRARERQGEARARARRASLHRQRGGRRGQGADGAWRRQGDPRDGDQRQGDDAA